VKRGSADDFVLTCLHFNQRYGSIRVAQASPGWIAGVEF
jgi:hypothetical protein